MPMNHAKISLVNTDLDALLWSSSVKATLPDVATVENSILTRVPHCAKHMKTYINLVNADMKKWREKNECTNGHVENTSFHLISDINHCLA